MITKNSENFSNVELPLYDKYPKYKYSENFFLVNGNLLNKGKTLEENHIKNNDTITLMINNCD